MGKIAFVFSGQGAQYSGMGQSLYENSAAAKQLYDAAESVRAGTMAQSFSGSADELKITKNTQPCLYLVDLTAALALEESGIHADGVAGFSLGEIAALAYAGAYTHEDGFKLVCARGALMQAAAEQYDTGMAAVLKLDAKTIENVCAEVDGVYPVNYNGPAQTVVAGLKDSLAVFKEKIAAHPCRVMDLAVGGGFHSPFMAEASDGFKTVLEESNICAPKLPVYANKTAQPYGVEVCTLLAEQIKSPVRWQQTVENMIADGYDTFIECGAGKTLCGLIKKISADVAVYNVQDKESLDATVKAVLGDA